MQRILLGLFVGLLIGAAGAVYLTRTLPGPRNALEETLYSPEPSGVLARADIGSLDDAPVLNVERRAAVYALVGSSGFDALRDRGTRSRIRSAARRLDVERRELQESARRPGSRAVRSGRARAHRAADRRDCRTIPMVARAAAAACGPAFPRTGG